MSKKSSEASDPRFHYEIWKGPSGAYGEERKSISYVENHNAQCGYAELAFDFSIAAELLIGQYRVTNYGNWVAPVAHISRQVIELLLKALMQAIEGRDNSFNCRPINGHNLMDIWMPCRSWLIEHGYQLLEDARLEKTDQLISAFHEIDPIGDLFRFGISRRTAFKKQKSYDRVGIQIDFFEQEFIALQGLLQHWEATLFRESIKEEMEWNEDPYFDPNDFPKKA